VNWTAVAQSAGPITEIHLTGNFAFAPNDITIQAGTRVRWVNDVAVFHTITPENAQQPGVWADAEVATAGQTFEHTFNTPGQTYRYRCRPHSSNFTTGMVGVIRVQ
jgi:plastocyanin